MTLTGELDGESRLADVKIGVKLNGDSVQGGVDSFGQQGAADLCQQHLVLGRSIPNLQHVVAGLRVEGQELEAENKNSNVNILHIYI